MQTSAVKIKTAAYASLTEPIKQPRSLWCKASHPAWPGLKTVGSLIHTKCACAACAGHGQPHRHASSVHHSIKQTPYDLLCLCVAQLLQLLLTCAAQVSCGFKPMPTVVALDGHKLLHVNIKVGSPARRQVALVHRQSQSIRVVGVSQHVDSTRLALVQVPTSL